MDNEITLIKNNQKRKWTDLQWIEEFYEFLKGELPEEMEMKNRPKLSGKTAFNIIWYLQEHFSILPDHIERCDICGTLYDSDNSGHYSELTMKHYCSQSCEPSNLYEKEVKKNLI